MTNTRRHRPLHTLSTAVIAAAALAVSACGSGDEAEQTDGIEQSPAPQGEGAPADGAQSEETSTAESTLSGSAEGGDLESVTAAIDTAESENGGTVHQIDWDDDEHWEIDVVGDREFEYQVSADGSTIEQTDEDDADSDDQREVQQAEVSVLEALDVALGDTPGTIDDAELDEDDGALHWEVGIYAEGSSDSTDIRIDAQTGDITGSDDDDTDDEGEGDDDD
ncbi:PepSY domain-containing protein [Brevibacterium jeotgali]|uniref:Peptidase propeptide and YPEB domain-containing protein n=1 Tax=Brevibacterium jeotgali TaxID=1262550 RepID=A0A2H1L2M1_9MICO|nr:PepSY domain-containing protein [Brevibacterium jeotgali]TWC03056.1 peptidase YpeB-like protein [Brevibacterium jeotgali]SMY11079.1 Peptidase propeptide and YPEB domain-containing protein [Brevibacterium jeotgali]